MKKIIIAFLIWRILLFVIAYFSQYFLPFKATFPYHEVLIYTGLPHFIWSFANFDGVHYLGIAEHAYASKFTQAFFPVYPILIKAVSYFVFGNLLISGLLVSNICFLIALIILKKLYNSFWVIIFTLTFPTAFFFGSYYTEGLFLLLITLAFYLAEGGKSRLPYLLAAIASGTKVVGVFLGPVLAIRRKSINIPGLLISMSGLLAYMVYLQIAYRNPLYFLTAQPVFGQERSATTIVLLPQVFYRYFKIFTTTSGINVLIPVLEFTATILAIVALLLAYKRMKREWVIFSFLAILVPTLTGTLTSMPRYILVAFPIYILLAMIKSTQAKILIASVFAILQAVLLTVFAQGYWVA